ncbi:MAG: class I SAM-dependent rRNA methyltransferase [Myxococcales bacterium]|nr:MAG: class I SAM-dependent rRNA methyltransferase [Myxococcales bacterium]
MKAAGSIVLRPGRERSVLNRHPWLFSGAVAKVEGKPTPGGLVAVIDAGGSRLAVGFYNPQSDIRVRLWAFGAEAERDFEDALRERLARAIAWRAERLDAHDTDMARLVNGEGDALGGVIVDHYAGHLVVEPLAFYIERHLDVFLAALLDAARPAFPVRSVRFRVESEAAAREGMTLADEARAITEAAPETTPARELGLTYRVDLARGQKTGFFIDQRDNRFLVRALAKDRRVLNLFAYTGGFTLNALAGGAREVVSVDASQPALDLLDENAALNGFSGRGGATHADVKNFLPQAQERSERFDLVVCDPPPFARKTSHVERASRAYKDVNRRAMSLLDDGLLLTFSCSPFIPSKLFRQIVFAAAVEAGREAAVLRELGPGLDHPVGLYHPEGAYLCGFLLRVHA